MAKSEKPFKKLRCGNRLWELGSGLERLGVAREGRLERDSTVEDRRGERG